MVTHQLQVERRTAKERWPETDVLPLRHEDQPCRDSNAVCDGFVVIFTSVGQVDLTQADESFDIPKPLIVALRELGPCTGPVIRILVEAGADADVEAYTGLSTSELRSIESRDTQIDSRV